MELFNRITEHHTDGDFAKYMCGSVLLANNNKILKTIHRGIPKKKKNYTKKCVENMWNHLDNHSNRQFIVTKISPYLTLELTPI